VRVDEHTITLGQEPVFYRSAPWTGAPVLYLHGLATSSDDWTPFLERTGGLAPDLPGFGRSGKGGHLDYTLDAHASFIEQFLAEQGIEQIRLVAHGWGAGAGLVLTQRHPDRIERLVLCNALPLVPGFHWHGVPRLLRRPLLGELIMGSTQQWMFARVLRSASASPSAWSGAALAAVWEQFDQGTQRAILRLLRSADEGQLAEHGSGLGTLRIPALVIWGERDPWFPPTFGDAYASRLPDATLERIAAAGHWPWLDDSGVTDRVAAFVTGG
jgi:pimeloyl-ACP methyl ester carboxylesterase